MKTNGVENDSEIILGRNKANVHRKAIKYLFNFLYQQNPKDDLNKTLPESIKPNNTRMNISFSSKKILKCQKCLPFLKKVNSSTKISESSRLKLRKKLKQKSSGLVDKTVGFKMHEAQELKPLLNLEKKTIKLLNFKDEPLSYIPISSISMLPESKTLNQLALNVIIQELRYKYRDTDKLYAITKNLKFFSLFKENIVKKLLSSSIYEFYEKGKMIFIEGDEARDI